jgi:23S rRNA (cytidine1920-2'-O)/16S rRNA (cytidine1409-2'-O)-methyltransferase
VSNGPDKSERLDVELVKRGLMVSRAQARAAIEAGKVRVDGVPASKPSAMVTPSSSIEAEPAHPWVSRGALKLEHALQAFKVDPKGLFCLDVGASTGGFTEILLHHGARRVFAVDTGHSQLHQKLKADSRVENRESTDARDLTAEMLGEAPDLIVCDASFIGLAKVLERVLDLASPHATLVALFKPQFEVGPAHVGKGGIVNDLAATDRAAEALENWLVSRGWAVEGWHPSPVLGGDGNRERLFYAKKRSS